MNMMSDPVLISLIGALTSILAALIALFNNILISRIKTSVGETQDKIVLLEKNTNSIKDALVKVTGEAEFAKGLKEGTEGKQASDQAVALIAEVHETKEISKDTNAKVTDIHKKA